MKSIKFFVNYLYSSIFTSIIKLNLIMNVKTTLLKLFLYSIITMIEIQNRMNQNYIEFTSFIVLIFL